jgi:hypothetical protein
MQRRKLLRNILTTLAATAGIGGSLAYAKPQTHPKFPHNWKDILAQKTKCTVVYSEQRGELLYAEVNGPHNTHFALYSPNGEHWYNTPEAIPHWRRTSTN